MHQPQEPSWTDDVDVDDYIDDEDASSIVNLHIANLYVTNPHTSSISPFTVWAITYLTTILAVLTAVIIVWAVRS